MKKVSEKRIEYKLNTAITCIGGKSIKIFNPWDVGLPDRLLLLPGGRVVFAELKSTGEKPRPIQIEQHKRLRELGFRVEVIDELEQIDELINDIQATYIPSPRD